MIEARYYFLFGLALIWIVIAIVNDLKKREVPNWLNFSLVGFALAYRAFYSAASSGSAIDIFSFYSLLLLLVAAGIPSLIYYFGKSSKFVRFFKIKIDLEYISFFLICMFIFSWIFLDFNFGFASSIFSKAGLQFFYQGLVGVGIFVALGNLFYYLHLFAGGDAKLLIGLGAVLPFESYWDFVFIGGGFIMVLLLAGAIYSSICSIFIAMANWSRFKGKFAENLGNKWYWAVVPAVFVALHIFFYFIIEVSLNLLLLSILISFAAYFMFVYLRAVDNCMIKWISPEKLTEGDWLVDNVHLGKSVIRKSVHGLNLKDIARLKKAGKKVLIKEGIPFTLAFLIAFLIMVFFLGVLEFDFQRVFLLFF